METGFRTEGFERQKIYGGLEAKLEAGCRYEACESSKVHAELANMKEVTSLKLSGSCAVSSAASTVYGPGSGTFARRKDVWHGSKQRHTMYIASMDIRTQGRSTLQDIWVNRVATGGS